MNKAAVFAVLAFLTSAAATTGIMVKLHRPVADSTAAGTPAALPDSISRGHRPDSLVADSLPAHSTGAPAETSPRAATAIEPGRSPSVATAESRPARPPVPPTPDPAARAAAFKQVARVLAAMKPPQAARVLSQLSDDEVEGILRAVGPRQAADFLTNLSVERAGVLSRRLLVPSAKGQT